LHRQVVLDQDLYHMETEDRYLTQGTVDYNRETFPVVGTLVKSSVVIKLLSTVVLTVSKYICHC